MVAAFAPCQQKSALSAIKAFLIACYTVLLGEVQTSRDVGDGELESSFDENEQPLTETKLRVAVTPKLTKDKKGYRPVYRWSPRPDDAVFAAADAAGVGVDENND